MTDGSPEEDQALVRRVLDGDPVALEELGARLQCVPRMLAAANRRLSNRLSNDDLADLSQDTVVQIWKKLETFEGRSTLEGWAWRFGVLELRNRVRGVARRRVITGASLSSAETEIAAPDPQPMPIDPKALEFALQSLPDEMSAVIHLKHDKGMIFRDIATELSIPENTAKTRYYRGLSRMREVLDRGVGHRGGERRDGPATQDSSSPCPPTDRPSAP